MTPTLLLALAAAATQADHPVDAYFEHHWKAEGVTPAPPADDHEFLRRLTYDVLGRPPRPDEIRAFGKDPDRTRRIDALLDSPEAAEYFADTWLRILLEYRFEQNLPLRMSFPAFRAYLKDAYAKDLPWRDFATQLISDHGDYTRKPATNFVLAALDPKEPPHRLAARIARIFLGTRVECARCHDHPFDRVSQEAFWGLTAFFKGLKPRSRRTFDGFGIKLMSASAPGRMAIPDTKIEVAPAYLDGRKPREGKDLLEELARFVVEDPRFARAIVNRTWARFMGRGFVEPVDRFTSRTKPDDPELLETLSRWFVANGTSVRKLSRLILTSRAYQLDCGVPPGTDPERFAHMRLKPQNPVQLLNTLIWTLNLDVFLKQFYGKFTGNTQLPETYRNPEVFRMYLHLFTQGLLAPGGVAPEETEYTGSVRLALKLMNGKDLQGLVRAGWGRLGGILAATDDPAERVDEIFTTLLGRPPTSGERDGYLDHIRRKRGLPRAYEDVYWTLLNSTELYFNH